MLVYLLDYTASEWDSDTYARYGDVQTLQFLILIRRDRKQTSVRIENSAAGILVRIEGIVG